MHSLVGSQELVLVKRRDVRVQGWEHVAAKKDSWSKMNFGFKGCSAGGLHSNMLPAQLC